MFVGAREWCQQGVANAKISAALNYKCFFALLVCFMCISAASLRPSKFCKAFIMGNWIVYYYMYLYICQWTGDVTVNIDFWDFITKFENIEVRDFFWIQFPSIWIKKHKIQNWREDVNSFRFRQILLKSSPHLNI